MHILDCPIPPPIVNGSTSSSIPLWKSYSRLKSSPVFVNCSSSDLLSTRIPLMIIQMKIVVLGARIKCHRLISNRHNQSRRPSCFSPERSASPIPIMKTAPCSFAIACSRSFGVNSGYLSSNS